jgi:hypothetical protein
MAKPKRDYEVGYKKPPVHSRWKKGQCGNRAGRPQKKPALPSLDAGIIEALAARVTVKENGTVRQVSKYDVALTQLANKAASGHIPTIKLLLPLLSRLAEAATRAAADESWNGTVQSARERVLRRLNQIRERVRQAESSAPENNSKKVVDDK